MRRSTTFVASTAGALAALLTAGCSGEPSDADITQALASAYKGVGLSDKHLLGLKAEKLGCEKEGKGYMCDFTVSSTSKLLGQDKQASRARFIHAGDGWTMTN